MSGQSVWSVSWWHFGQWLVMVILSNFIALSVCVVLWSVVWHFGQWLVMVSLTCQPTVCMSLMARRFLNVLLSWLKRVLTGSVSLLISVFRRL